MDEYHLSTSSKETFSDTFIRTYYMLTYDITGLMTL